jgi:hypothetical protein
MPRVWWTRSTDRSIARFTEPTGVATWRVELRRSLEASWGRPKAAFRCLISCGAPSPSGPKRRAVEVLVACELPGVEADRDHSGRRRHGGQPADAAGVPEQAYRQQDEEGQGEHVGGGLGEGRQPQGGADGQHPRPAGPVGPDDQATW